MSSKFVSNKKTTKAFDDDGEENTLNQMVNLSKEVNVPSRSPPPPPKGSKVKPLLDIDTDFSEKRYEALHNEKRYEEQRERESLIGILSGNKEVLDEVCRLSKSVKLVDTLCTNIYSKQKETNEMLSNKITKVEEDYTILKELNDLNIKELDEKDTELTYLRKNQNDMSAELIKLGADNMKMTKDGRGMRVYLFYSAAVNFVIVSLFVKCILF